LHLKTTKTITSKLELKTSSY